MDLLALADPQDSVDRQVSLVVADLLALVADRRTTTRSYEGKLREETSVGIGELQIQRVAMLRMSGSVSGD